MNKIRPPISDKKTIRAEVKGKIALLSEEDKNQAALSISARLLEMMVVQKSTNLIIYEALRDEVNLEYVIREAQKLNKNIITITPSGHYIDLPEKGIILVPGQAFTLSGKRIGRGAGWYDRFLREYPRFHRIGICFNCQIFSDLPQEEHDISMNEVIAG